MKVNCVCENNCFRLILSCCLEVRNATTIFVVNKYWPSIFGLKILSGN